MLSTRFAFEHIIQPISPEVFFREYWEKRPLHISRGKPGYYSELFSGNDVDTLLQFCKPKYPRVEIGKNNKRGYSLEVLEQMETTSVHDYGVPNSYNLYNTYTQGDTLVIYKLEEYWKPLAELCRAFEQYFSCLANAALFLTPKHAQGFPMHFDATDAFILQAEGSKVWRIYNASPYLALGKDDQPYLADNLPAPEQELCLQAGDLLYVPRGCVHEVLTTDAPSLHITVDTKLFTWVDFITHALASVSKNFVPFHKALPVGFLNQHQSVPFLQEHLTELLEYLRQHANAEEAVTQLARDMIDKMSPLPDGHFSQLDHLDQISLSSVVAKRQGMVCRVFKQPEIAFHFMGDLQGEKQVSIQFPGNEVTGPAWLEPAFRFIANTETFVVQALPDSLSHNSKLVLVRRLIREGLLKVVSANNGEVPAAQGETCSTAGGISRLMPALFAPEIP
jgi:ribosomal protein L16 Arg81 hydroxylase